MGSFVRRFRHRPGPGEIDVAARLELTRPERATLPPIGREPRPAAGDAPAAGPAHAAGPTAPVRVEAIGASIEPWPGGVRAWSQPVVIPTYAAMPPDRNPMFLEKRVYQGSSGRVYPNGFVDRVSDEKRDRAWAAVHLENEYVRVTVLPEIGGRIHIGFDKTTGYDFFYRQTVIKPALVGLLGPWISGGVEFNWPQHHRPSTYMPVDWTIEEHPDGSKTVWLSEHEPMDRMKGMVGITLHPGRSIVEARVRLFNRTPHVRTFLWWANAAVRVHDRYQSFFPPDVTYVADHAKRAMSTFPVARGHYYGVDYGARPPEDADLSWYRTIPVPTSYMAMGTEGDFFGGYDHAADSGFVHVANHHISPGKKQWTWGNHEFGWAWDRNLTDTAGPYIELMAGVYTDNQPDFSFLAPYETRTFIQAWYPIQRIGPAHQATLDAAVSLTVADGVARLGVAVSGAFPGARVRLEGPGGIGLLERVGDLRPGEPVVERVDLPPGTAATDLRLTVVAADGRELVAYRPRAREEGPIPEPATEPPLPGEITSVDELYVTGLHLWQYRHATRSAEPYWREGLRRDPGDARCNTALGVWHLERGEFALAERRFRAAIERLTRRNPNPYDGEPWFRLGIALRFQGRLEEAYAALYKATWNAAWQGPSFHALAEIDARRGRFETALDHLDRALAANGEDTAARNLAATLLRLLGRLGEAGAAVAATLADDPLDAWALRERRLIAAARGEDGGSAANASGPLVPRPDDVQLHLDLALDYAAAGRWSDAMAVLEPIAPRDASVAVHPMLHYTLGWLAECAGDPDAAALRRRLGAAMPADLCFPARLEEIAVLGSAIAADPSDARAPYYLGNLLYDRRRYDEAIEAWERARALDPAFPTVLRNLGIAEFNVRRRPRRARSRYVEAFAADPTDGRILYELDQLLRRLNVAPAERLARLQANRDLVGGRDDLATEYATLLNDLGRSDEALAFLLGRRFHPWEGGEGLVSRQYVVARLRLARGALADGRPEDARDHASAALEYPANLGEGKHVVTPEHETFLVLGDALAALGDEAAARAWRERATEPSPARDEPSEATYWRAEALVRLGRGDEAAELLTGLRAAARRRRGDEVRIDYFATSLPSFLLFEDDLGRRNEVEWRYLLGLAHLGLGDPRRAAKQLRRVVALDASHQGAAAALARALDGLAADEATTAAGAADAVDDGTDGQS